MTEPLSTTIETESLKRTPLDGLHRALGARMVPFAGYEMPVQYAHGIISEHAHCRSHAALFDVSHMGQFSLRGTYAAAALELLVPGDMSGMAPGRQRYTLFLNEAGGIIDDLMIANAGNCLRMVVNASRKSVDAAHLAANLPDSVKLVEHPDRALLALQGPSAATVLGRMCPETAGLAFMQVADLPIMGITCWVSRSGYTGEDGFEISVPAEEAERFARALLDQPEVHPAGLGARDSLRLEAGLCLYGQDLDETTSPIEAGLAWTIAKRRKMEWNFRGADPVREQMDNGVQRKRVGIRPDGRAPARAGTEIAAPDGSIIGTITSGTFGPTLGAPVAMGYVKRGHTADDTPLDLMIRGRAHSARVAPTPFVPHRYAR